MFFPSNETIQNLTEKTKLLAQKCTHQIQQHLHHQQNHYHHDKTITGNKKDKIDYGSEENDDESNIGCIGFSDAKNRGSGDGGGDGKNSGCASGTKQSFTYFCACTGGSLRGLTKKHKDGEPTVKWYVKPTWRLWGEEREKDAVFTVYLKKVRYHRPTPSAKQDSDDEISHLEWETVRVRFVKAATLARLVEALATDDGELESTFINVFLSTYRTFSNLKEVLSLLVKRYEKLNDMIIYESQYPHEGGVAKIEEHKKTLVSALHVWLEGFPEDWNEQNLRQLLAFTSKRLPHSDLHIRVLNRLDRITHIPSNYSSMDSYIPWTNPYPDFAEQFAGLCLAPALRGPPSHLLQSYRFPHVPVKHFAEQMTRMDMELFKRLIPHQCLGATWSRRDKNEAPTVVATVTQFNAVSYRVISSILIEPRLKQTDRAQIIATWIDIAQELRLLKNFSSLKAIISGLQSNPVYRLSKTWAALPREKMEIFNELARIFSEDNNAWVQREVLMREGTAKFADTVGENDRHLQKVFQKQSMHTSYGTIPYLGTFLTDLTMIHAAIPDTLPDGLINFDKKRKEFEVLAQIKLLQGAANTYQLHEDHLFDRWFASMLVLDEREAHTLSCQLEPPTEPRRSNSSGHRKTDSITSNSSSGAGSQFYCDILNNSTSRHSSRHNSLDRDATPPNPSILSASSSVSNLSAESSGSSGQKFLSNMKHVANGKTPLQNGVPIINAQLVQTSPAKNTTPDFYIIRVTFETDHVELDGIVLYKSIMLGNNERTPQVIRNAMMKLGLEDDPDKYTLAQVLPDKELVMPANANVYYAVNTNYNLNFILRLKRN